MVLSGTSIFPQNRVRTEEESLLLERWQQEGSNLKNFTGDNINDHTIYTVTSGKVLYITSIVVSIKASDAGRWQLKDTSGGSTLLDITDSTTVGNTHTITFKIPLKFLTEVYCNEVSACDALLSFSGWEEDA